MNAMNASTQKASVPLAASDLFRACHDNANVIVVAIRSADAIFPAVVHVLAIATAGGCPLRISVGLPRRNKGAGAVVFRYALFSPLTDYGFKNIA